MNFSGLLEICKAYELMGFGAQNKLDDLLEDPDIKLGYTVKEQILEFLEEVLHHNIDEELVTKLLEAIND